VQRLLERTEQVADRFGVIVDGGAADFVETDGCVESIGSGIRRIEVDFANDARVAGGFGSLEEIGVKGPGIPLSAGGWRCDDTVDVDEVGS